MWKRGLRGRDSTSAREMCIKGKLFMIALPTPITITVPPRRAVYVAVHTLLSTPVHSSTVSGATYSLGPNSARIAWALPWASFAVSTWYGIQEGTNSFANANREGSKSVTTIG